ncbi:MAG: sigma-70 family RNA polymerase sigma factor [Alphaproteobacteria bacterium]|nr:sigma-70 family RNA polymerase sigma factor [Alphaproteobacteria bacterium]
MLVRAASDPALRTAVVERWAGLVWALCRRLSPTPDDSYQAAWAHLLPRLHHYDPSRAAPATWLTTVVHRRLVDEHRRRGRQAEILPLHGPDPARELQARGPSADETLDRNRRARALEQALARLPEDQRRVVVLHHLHGLSLADIADAEDVAVGTLKSRLHRGRARLLTLLGASS